MQAADVLRLVSGALQDLEPGMESRWKWEGGADDTVGLLDFLNLAMSELVMQRPDAMAQSGTLRLEYGMWQRVPHNALLFIGLNHNVTEDGRMQGTPIIAMPPETILAWSRAWALPSPWVGEYAGVECFAYDRMADPRRFLVFPAVPDACEAMVCGTWSVSPSLVKSVEDCLCLADTYQSALVHHVLYSILSGDNEASNLQKAQYHLSAYYQALGIKQQVDMAWPKHTGGTV